MSLLDALVSKFPGKSPLHLPHPAVHFLCFVNSWSEQKATFSHVQHNKSRPQKQAGGSQGSRNGTKCTSQVVHATGCTQGFGPGCTTPSHWPDDGNTRRIFNQQLQPWWISSYKEAVRSINQSSSLCDSEKQQELEAWNTDQEHSSLLYNWWRKIK